MEEMSNLPKALRQQLAKHYSLRPLELLRKQGSKDSTRKFLWRLADHSLIESVLMQSSTYCERDASGKPLIRRNWLHIRQLMTVFKNGCKQESSSNFGKRDSKSSMNCEGSIGTGFRWTEPEPSRH